MPADPRPRCDARSARKGFDLNGNLSDTATDGLVRVVVHAGRVLSGVTLGKLKSLISSGPVEEYVFPADTPHNLARAAVDESLRTKQRDGLCGYMLDSALLHGRVGPLRSTRKLVAYGIDRPGRFSHYTKHRLAGMLQHPSHHLHLRRIASMGRERALTSLTALSRAMVPTEQLAPGLSLLAQGVDVSLVSYLLTGADPAILARLAESHPGALCALAELGAQHQDLAPQLLVAMSAFARQGLVFPQTGSTRDWIRELAGFDAKGSNQLWAQHLAHLARTSDPRLRSVMELAFGGRMNRSWAGGLTQVEPSTLLRLPPGALCATMSAMEREASVADPDLFAFSSRVVATFGKQSASYLDLAGKLGWSLHDAASALGDGRMDGFADWCLRQNATSWSSRTAAREALQQVCSMWPGNAATLTTMSLRDAAIWSRSTQQLSPVWADTGFGRVAGRVRVSGTTARTGGRVWAASLLAPSMYPTGVRYVHGEYTGEFLPRTAGESLLVGNLVNSCERLGGMGEACALDSQVNATSGRFVVRRGGEVVATSWVWYDSKGRGYCFDNIERLEQPGKETGVHDALRAVYDQAAAELASMAPGGVVSVGSRYTDDKLLKGLKTLPPEELLQPSGYHGSYRDSDEHQVVLARGEPSGTWFPRGPARWSHPSGPSASGEVRVGSSSLELHLTVTGPSAAPEVLDALLEVTGSANPHMRIVCGGLTREALQPLDPQVLKSLFEDLGERFGPDDVAEVQEYLRQDPKILGLPGPLRGLLKEGHSLSAVLSLVEHGITNPQTARGLLHLRVVDMNHTAKLIPRYRAEDAARELIAFGETYGRDAIKEIVELGIYDVTQVTEMLGSIPLDRFLMLARVCAGPAKSLGGLEMPAGKALLLEAHTSGVDVPASAALRRTGILKVEDWQTAKQQADELRRWHADGVSEAELEAYANVADRLPPDDRGKFAALQILVESRVSPAAALDLVRRGRSWPYDAPTLVTMVENGVLPKCLELYESLQSRVNAPAMDLPLLIALNAVPVHYISQCRDLGVLGARQVVELYDSGMPVAALKEHLRVRGQTAWPQWGMRDAITNWHNGLRPGPSGTQQWFAHALQPGQPDQHRRALTEVLVQLELAGVAVRDFTARDVERLDRFSDTRLMEVEAYLRETRSMDKILALLNHGVRKSTIRTFARLVQQQGLEGEALVDALLTAIDRGVSQTWIESAGVLRVGGDLDAVLRFARMGTAGLDALRYLRMHMDLSTQASVQELVEFVVERNLDAYATGKALAALRPLTGYTRAGALELVAIGLREPYVAAALAAGAASVHDVRGLFESSVPVAVLTRAAAGDQQSVASVSAVLRGATRPPGTKDEFDVVLESRGPNMISVLGAVRRLTGLSLRDAKALVDSAPAVILSNVDHDTAHEVVRMLKEHGATVRVT